MLPTWGGNKVIYRLFHAFECIGRKFIFEREKKKQTKK